MHTIAVMFQCLPLVMASPGGEPLETPGKVDAVTVYRGQALVTRLVDVPRAPGLQEIVVTGLPEHVLPGSIHAESSPGVEIRSVRYRGRPVVADVNEEVRQIDQTIRDIQDRIDAVQRLTALAGERKAYLDKLEQFSAISAGVELSQGVLNAETLERLSEYMKTERRALVDEELRLGIEKRALEESLRVEQRRRGELTAGSARTAREAVLFVQVHQPEEAALRLRYLVDKANWTPSYNVRTEGQRRALTVEYSASIQQMSGEDWGDVAMTLSTATPTLTAKSPELSALLITLSSQQTELQQQAAGKGYAFSRMELATRQRQVEHEGVSQVIYDIAAPTSNSKAYFDKELNEVANDIQILDLMAGERVRPGETKIGTDEGYSVVYQVASRTSLPSRADRQLIQIASLPMEGEFYKLAVPVLTSYVYDEASVVNTSPMVLLAGPVSTYVNGEFVGQAELPTVAAGERFTVGFGIDSSLRAGRELVKRKDDSQGGNRIVDFTYRLTVENFGTDPTSVCILDRLPTARGDGKAIRITLTSPGEHVFAGAQATDADRKNGMLRWQTDVPPQAAGADAAAIEYQFRLEYDRQMSIVGMTQL